jgi:threonine dehydrogenase-like Zn-dependent dehydrogenase
MTTATAAAMRAIAFTAKESAELVDWPLDPAPLRADEVAGRTLATLASPGTELNGYLAERAQPALSGYSAVFAVDEVGAEVTDVRPGDIVFAMGPHASRQRVHRSMVVPVPRGLDPAVAVFCRLMGVGWSTLTTTTARPPDRVLVTGLGPVGNLAAQVFAAAGYEVTAVDPVPARRELAARHGLRDLHASAEKLGEEAALAVECSGHERAVLDGINAVRKRGEVALVGVPWRQRSDLSAHALLHAVFHRYVVVRSGWEWEVPMHPREFACGSIIANWAAGLRWLADRRVRVDGMATVVSPKDAQRVWQDLLHQRGSPTVVFDWNA